MAGSQLMRLVAVWALTAPLAGALAPVGSKMRRRVASLRSRLKTPTTTLAPVDLSTESEALSTVPRRRDSVVKFASAVAGTVVNESPTVLDTLPYVIGFGFAGYRGYKAYKTFTATQEKLVKEYGRKAGRAKSLDKAKELFASYKKQTYGRKKRAMFSAAMTRLCYDPVSMEGMDKFENLLAATGEPMASLPAVAEELENAGLKNKLLFYARRKKNAAKADVEAVFSVVDAGSEPGFVDQIQKSLGASAYESAVRFKALGESLPDENTTVAYVADPDAQAVLGVDDETAADVLAKMNRSEEEVERAEADAKREDRKGLMEEKADRVNAEDVPLQNQGFSKQFREPPKSERLIEMQCVMCKHNLFVQPREQEKFFAGFKECPKCQSKQFKKLDREQIWYDYLGKDPKKDKPLEEVPSEES